MARAPLRRVAARAPLRGDARARRSRALGGYRDFDGPEDYELWLRAFDAGLRFAKLADVCSQWRDCPGG